MTKTLLALFLLFTAAVKAFALPLDSTVNKVTYKTSVKTFYEKNFMSGNTSLVSPDSSLLIVSAPHPAMNFHNNFPGTAGSASSPQLFGIQYLPFTFSSIRSFDLQLFHSDSMLSYKTNKRFTELSYNSSAFKEQRIAVLHTQNITKGWNAGMIFDRQGVKDFMNFSDTYRSRFALFSSYNTGNKKYYLFAHAFWNRIRNDVNGGLLSDSLFDNTTVSNLGIKGLAYKISNAKESRRKREIYLSQYYDLGKTNKDSGGTVIKNGPSFLLHHEISYERNSYTYSDSNTDSSFYYNFYYGSTTLDSLGTDDLRNTVAILMPADSMYGSNFMKKWSSQIFGEHIQTKYRQRSDSTWNNFAIGAETRLLSDTILFGFFIRGKYVFKGFDKDNYCFNAKVFSPDLKAGQLSASIDLLHQNPDFIYRLYDSNNFYWRNDFLKVNTFAASLNYENKKYQIEFSAKNYRIENYVYMDENAFPKQYADLININSFSLNKNFIFRKWHLNNTLTYQKTDKDGILHIPNWVTENTLYNEKKYFKNALLMALGLSVNYNSLYYADAFMPSNALFYLQNEKQVGGYARIDVFAIAKIKTARIFLRMENAFDGVFKKSYYLIPHYPMPGRVLKFGLVWRFFDQ